MAETKSNVPSSQQERGVSSRESYTPGFLNSRDFFSMSPFELMRRFTDEMDRFFEGGASRFGGRHGWSPNVEVRQKNNDLVVCADLPGLSKDDVKVEVTDQGLVIQGERKQQHEQREQGYYRSERSYGQFYRVIPLPEDAKLDQAKAQFNNGVLEVTIPVPESEHTRRQIPIESEAKARTSGGGA